MDYYNNIYRTYRYDFECNVQLGADVELVLVEH